MKIGKFGLLNNFLPYYWLEKQPIDVIEASPKRLAEMLERKEIDFAPVPSFYFLKKKDMLKSYEFCIASLKKALSVVVISNGKRLDEDCIAITNQTLTSVNLLRIILEERRMKNRLVMLNESKASELLKHCKHALVVGDEAIKARMIYRVVMDLGEEWYELTGYPMVFGISASLRERNAGRISKLLIESVDWGIKHLSEVVEVARQKFSMPAEFLEKYFTALSYRVGAKERKGLKAFEEMCHENELV
jgi:chorismate dehydratase